MSRLTGRFKIDVNIWPSELYPIALFKEVKGRWFTWWEVCESYPTREAARAHYEKLKIKENFNGLPEYLD